MTTPIPSTSGTILLLGLFVTGCSRSEPGSRSDEVQSGARLSASSTVVSNLNPDEVAAGESQPLLVTSRLEELVDSEHQGLTMELDVEASDLRGASELVIAPIRRELLTVLRVNLGGGRTVIRSVGKALVGSHEWRADRRFGGLLLQTATGHKVIPPGALRTFLNEGRPDVLPLAPSRLVTGAPGRYGSRPTERSTLTTGYGTLFLEQIALDQAGFGWKDDKRERGGVLADSGDLEPKPRVDPFDGGAGSADTGADSSAASNGNVDVSGTQLCRFLAELIVSDRALVGSPCRDTHLPVAGEITFVGGGGLRFSTRNLASKSFSRVDLSIPVVGSRAFERMPMQLRSFALIDARRLTVLGSGDLRPLELSSRAEAPRIAWIEGLPVALLTPEHDVTVLLHTSRYVVEWRSLLGERVEPPLEVGLPGRVQASPIGFKPSSSPSASSMASARNGP